MLKKSLILSGFLVGGILLTGCTNQSNQQAPVTTTGEVPAAEEKSGDTIKTGLISQSGANYFIQVPGQQPEAIDSYAVDLSAYVGQTITITGQYSGDTLFVGKIE